MKKLLNDWHTPLTFAFGVFLASIICGYSIIYSLLAIIGGIVGAYALIYFFKFLVWWFLPDVYKELTKPLSNIDIEYMEMVTDYTREERRQIKRKRIRRIKQFFLPGAST